MCAVSFDSFIPGPWACSISCHLLPQESSLEISASHARETLRAKGYSFRRAAEALGYSYSHFSKVLSGIHQGDPVLQAVAEMSPSTVPYRVSGFALKGAK